MWNRKTHIYKDGSIWMTECVDARSGLVHEVEMMLQHIVIMELCGKNTKL